MEPKHEKDFYGWAVANVALLKQGRFNEVDIENVIEEIDALGRAEENELVNRLSLIIAHLLKWQYQATLRGHSWLYTIREQRKQAKNHFEDNPSLKSKLDKVLLRAYDIAISRAATETGLEEKTFPLECPYTFDQIIDKEFYPE